MFSSLRSRLFLTYVLVVAVALGVVALVTLVYLARNPVQVLQTRARLALAMETVIERARNSPANLSENRRLLLQRVDENFDVRFLVLDADGAVLYDTRAGEADLSAALRLVERARLAGVAVVQDETGARWFVTARQITPDFYLVAAAPRPELTLREALRSRSDEVVSFLRLGGAAALILSFILALAMSRWIAGPLQNLAQVTRNIPRGEYQPQTPRGPDEVQTLMRAFNEMAAQVESSRRSQRDFVANVSHELKTPLTSIQGFAQAIMDGTAADVRGAARVILDEAARMHRLVLDLLDLARLDAGTFEFRRQPVDLEAVLQNVVAHLQPQAEAAQVQLTLQSASLPPLMGDGDRLAQVFTNLVDNAIRHTPAGGQVSVWLAQEGEQVTVGVKDTGEGIPPAEVERIFERFYRVDKARPGGKRHGTGLGLAIARQLVEAHGGTIAVHSTPGQGSEFVVKLPLALPGDETLARRRS